MEVMRENETVQKMFWEFKGEADFIDKWALMSTPAPIVMIAIAYLLFVLKLGPEYMKKRPPFTLNNLLLIYNTTQVLVSCFIFVYGVKLLWPTGALRMGCLMDKEDARLVATGIYYYLLAKISELLDTVFFVLRKKDKQITFLHVYHHSLMMLTTWLVLKYEPTYTTIFLGTLNSLVHVLMYSYYGLSTFPDIAKYLWWKKYITKIQLIQFIAVIIQAAVNYVNTRCPPSYMILTAIFLNASLFLYLFGDFYVKAYLKNRKDNQVTKKLPKAAQTATLNGKKEASLTNEINNTCNKSEKVM